MLPEERADLERKELIEKQFSGWDGSHRELVKLVKQNLNDPKSYEHDKTMYFDMKDYIVVNMHYRANNQFGAKVKGFIKAECELDGSLRAITQTE